MNKKLLAVLWVGLVLLSRLLKLSMPIGEQAATITCLSVIFPLIAYFFSSIRALALPAGVWGILYLLHPIPLTMGIPTLLATLSFKASRDKNWLSYALHLFLPVIAIALFTFANPAAWTYSLYWLIPIIALFFRPTLVTRALQSTFTAHAAGSIIWAFFRPLTTAQWLSLIPVVAVERLLAVGMAICVIQCLAALVSPKREQQNAVSSQTGIFKGLNSR